MTIRRTMMACPAFRTAGEPPTGISYGAASERERAVRREPRTSMAFASLLGHHAGEQTVKLSPRPLLRGARVGRTNSRSPERPGVLIIGLPGFDVQQATQRMSITRQPAARRRDGGRAEHLVVATGGIACYPEHSRDPAELCWRASSARATWPRVTRRVRPAREENKLRRQIRILGDFPWSATSWRSRSSRRSTAGRARHTRCCWQHPELALLMRMCSWALWSRPARSRISPAGCSRINFVSSRHGARREFNSRRRSRSTTSSTNTCRTTCSTS